MSIEMYFETGACRKAMTTIQRLQSFAWTIAPPQAACQRALALTLISPRYARPTRHIQLHAYGAGGEPSAANTGLVAHDPPSEQTLHTRQLG